MGRVGWGRVESSRVNCIVSKNQGSYRATVNGVKEKNWQARNKGGSEGSGELPFQQNPNCL